MVEPIIKKKAAFQVLAMSREFHLESCMTEIPKFWTWYTESGYMKLVCGVFGICYGGSSDGKTFRYAIASPYDGKSPVPDQFDVLTIPAQTWAIFSCIGPAVETIQKMWKHIYGEWISNSEYEKLSSFDIEEYTSGNLSAPNYESFIWIPVRRKTSASNYSVKLDSLDPEDFIRLFRSVGWTPPEKAQAEVALKHSLAVFSLYSNGILIGMARLLGDAGMSYLLKDLIVIPEYQQRGAGTFLLQQVLNFIGKSLPKGWKASLELLSVPGKELFYKTQGFQELPSCDLSAGMIRLVEGVAESPKK